MDEKTEGGAKGFSMFVLEKPEPDVEKIEIIVSLQLRIEVLHLFISSVVGATSQRKVASPYSRFGKYPPYGRARIPHHPREEWGQGERPLSLPPAHQKGERP